MDVNEGRESGLRQRLSNNNKLWLICLLVLIAVTVRHAVQLGESHSRAPLATVDVKGVAEGTYDDEDHLQLAADLEDIARKRGIVMMARFAEVSQLDITVPRDTSGDEISYLSRFAATAIYRKFGNVPVIYAYTTGVSRTDEAPELIAITRWSERERNFLTRFERPADID